MERVFIKKSECTELQVQFVEQAVNDCAKFSNNKCIYRADDTTMHCWNDGDFLRTYESDNETNETIRKITFILNE